MKCNYQVPATTLIATFDLLLLILRNLNKKQVINTKNTVFRGKARHPSGNLAQKNLSD